MFKKKKKEKTLSEKAVSGLKKQASKRKIGSLIGLDRNKALEEAFKSSFNN